MMSDNTVGMFVGLLIGGGALDLVGTSLVCASRGKRGGRVLFIGAMLTLGGIMLGLSTV